MRPTDDQTLRKTNTFLCVRRNLGRPAVYYNDIASDGHNIQKFHRNCAAKLKIFSFIWNNYEYYEISYYKIHVERGTAFLGNGYRFSSD